MVCICINQQTVLQIINTKSYCESSWVPSQIFKLGYVTVYWHMSFDWKWIYLMPKSIEDGTISNVPPSGRTWVHFLKRPGRSCMSAPYWDWRWCVLVRWSSLGVKARPYDFASKAVAIWVTLILAWQRCWIIRDSLSVRSSSKLTQTTHLIPFRWLPNLWLWTKWHSLVNS